MPKIYSYLRFSSRDQALGDSKRRQLEDARKWAEDRGLTIDEEMSDLGISAYRGLHRREGALGEFLEMVRDGHIEEGSTLIVESLDRLTREGITGAFGLFTSILDKGIRIVTLGDKGREYTKDPNIGDLMYSLVVLARAHDESRMKSKRVAKAWRNKQARARDGSDRRALTKKLPEWLQVDEDKNIQPIPERVAVIKEIFRQSAAGVGRRRIVQALNEQGEPTWGRAAMWHDSYVTKLLGWRAVLGEYQPYRIVFDKDGRKRRKKVGEPIPDFYPQVIDHGLFKDAQAGKDSRRLRGGRQGKIRNNLLVGLVRCGSCGGTMMYSDKGKKGGPPALVCYRSTRKAGCDHKLRYLYPFIEMTVLSGLSRASLRALASDGIDHLRSLQVEQARINADLAEKERALDAFLESFGSEPSPRIAAKMRSLGEEIEVIENEVKRLESEIQAASASSRITGDELYNLIQTIYRRQRVVDEAERYVIRSDLANRIRQVVEGVVCQDGKAVIEYGDGSAIEYDDNLIRYRRKHKIFDPDSRGAVRVIRPPRGSEPDEPD